MGEDMSFRRIKMMDVELSHPLQPIEGLYGYDALKVLVQLHGAPLGYIELSLSGGRCSAAALGRAILEQHSWAIIHHLVSDGLAASVRRDQLRIDDLVGLPHPDLGVRRGMHEQRGHLHLGHRVGQLGVARPP